MMSDFTLNEIHSQPEVWQQIIELCEKQEFPKITEWMRNEQPVLTGSGSSFYLCLTAAACYTQLTHRRALAVSASDLCTFPDSSLPETEKFSLLAVSRNGKSAETVDAARWYRKSRAIKPIAISTVTDSPLLEVCEAGLLLSPAAETSRYMTRSFTSPILAIQYLIASSTGNKDLKKELRRLPEIGAQVIKRCSSTVKFIAEQKEFTDYAGLGQGPYYGLAAESMLKVQEMVRAPAHAYPSLEVMHGPHYLLSGKTLVSLLCSDGGKGYEPALLQRMQSTRACRFVICEKASPETVQNTEFVFELCSGLSEFARLILSMPVMQLFAYYRARATGYALE
jgi:glucosamine--fructose-6-phosphate aminotransferase (isomerizing)